MAEPKITTRRAREQGEWPFYKLYAIPNQPNWDECLLRLVIIISLRQRSTFIRILNQYVSVIKWHYQQRIDLFAMTYVHSLRKTLKIFVHYY